MKVDLFRSGREWVLRSMCWLTDLISFVDRKSRFWILVQKSCVFVVTTLQSIMRLSSKNLEWFLWFRQLVVSPENMRT